MSNWLHISSWLHNESYLEFAIDFTLIQVNNLIISIDNTQLWIHKLKIGYDARLVKSWDLFTDEYINVPIFLSHNLRMTEHSLAWSPAVANGKQAVCAMSWRLPVYRTPWSFCYNIADIPSSSRLTAIYSEVGPFHLA